MSDAAAFIFCTVLIVYGCLVACAILLDVCQGCYTCLKR